MPPPPPPPTHTPYLDGQRRTLVARFEGAPRPLRLAQQREEGGGGGGVAAQHAVLHVVAAPPGAPDQIRDVVKPAQPATVEGGLRCNSLGTTTGAIKPARPASNMGELHKSSSSGGGGGGGGGGGLRMRQNLRPTPSATPLCCCSAAAALFNEGMDDPAPAQRALPRAEDHQCVHNQGVVNAAGGRGGEGERGRWAQATLPSRQGGSVDQRTRNRGRHICCR